MTHGFLPRHMQGICTVHSLSPAHLQDHMECINSSVHQKRVQWPARAKLEKTSPEFQRSQSHFIVEMWQILCDCQYSNSGLVMSILVSSPFPISLVGSSFSISYTPVSAFPSQSLPTSLLVSYPEAHTHLLFRKMLYGEF